MSERRHSRRARARSKRKIRLACGLVAITGTVVFGMASTASATTVSVCASRRAVPGDTISQFVYDWGMSWRNPLDVWRVAQANPSIVNPNILEVGEVVTDCSTGHAANLSTAGFVTHALMPGETIRSLEAAATGDWHHPIPEWVLAQANASLPSPDAGTPGVDVHLLPGSPPATAQAPAVVPHAPAVTVDPLPVTAGAPPVRNYSPAVTAPNIPATIPPPATYEAPARDLAPPTTYEPSTTTTAAAATTAPSSGPSTVPAAAPPTPPPAPPPAAPVLPPATLPPDPPKIVEEPTTTTTPPSTPPTTDPPTMGAMKAAPDPAPDPAAINAVATAEAGAAIGPGYYPGHPDPADPNVVKEVWLLVAHDQPWITPEGAASEIAGFIQESGLDPNAVNPCDGHTADGSCFPSVGIAQWNNGRLPADMPHTLADEVQHATDELNAPDFAAVKAAWSKPDQPQAVYDQAEAGYEGYGKKGMRDKLAAAIRKAVGR